MSVSIQKTRKTQIPRHPTLIWIRFGYVCEYSFTKSKMGWQVDVQGVSQVFTNIIQHVTRNVTCTDSNCLLTMCWNYEPPVKNKLHILQTGTAKRSKAFVISKAFWFHDSLK